MDDRIFVEVYIPTVSCFYDLELTSVNTMLDIVQFIQEFLLEEFNEFHFLYDAPIVIHHRLQVILPNDFLVKYSGLQEGDRIIIL